jgi:hypothetical protein
LSATATFDPAVPDTDTGMTPLLGYLDFHLEYGRIPLSEWRFVDEKSDDG